MRYLPNSDPETRDMLRAVGVERYEDLLEGIPAALIGSNGIDLPPALTEMELVDEINAVASANDAGSINFLGGGSYDHFIPRVVDFLINRSEFYTAYTPYQAEVSQGTLQAMYEFQSMICALTGMDVANASMYDGATALAEAAMMARNITGKNRILVAGTISPLYREVLDTYAKSLSLDIDTVAADDYVLNPESLVPHLTEDAAAFVLQSPNFFGYVEAAEKMAALCAERNVLFIQGTDPISLAVLKAPGAYGADIVFAEGQVLGNHRNFGGPYLGIFTAKQKYVRKMPGRIIGATKDTEGRRGFVLTLQTREQHIRREKATSNICSNQGLNALAATVYMSLMGRQGLRDVAESATQKAHYLHDGITALPGFEPASNAPFFKEFTVKTPVPAKEIVSQLYKNHNILAGIPLSEFYSDRTGELLIAVTEKRTRAQMDEFISALKKL